MKGEWDRGWEVKGGGEGRGKEKRKGEEGNGEGKGEKGRGRGEGRREGRREDETGGKRTSKGWDSKHNITPVQITRQHIRGT